MVGNLNGFLPVMWLALFIDAVVLKTYFISRSIRMYFCVKYLHLSYFYQYEEYVYVLVCLFPEMKY